jgi:enoyl-CoA hydratase/carnithine racemase
LFADVLTAHEALHLGLSNAVMPSAELLEFALHKARTAAELPSQGVAQIKAALNRSIRGASLEQCMDDEARHYVRLRQLPAHQHALKCINDLNT